MNKEQFMTSSSDYASEYNDAIDAKDFDKYQRFTEQTITSLSNRITELEEQLNVFTNLLEISQYINQYIKSSDLFPLINDMLIGVFGAKYSTIYIKSGNNYIPVTPKEFSAFSINAEKELISRYDEKVFIINSEKCIYNTTEENLAIHSCLGIPIQINNITLGFVIIQHQRQNYFTKQHVTFLSSLANHIGVAIENNMLYNQIRESACKDGLTNIFNKKYFFDTLHSMKGLQALDYSIVMIDIDDFKRVNDTYGHPYGDEVLKVVASIIGDHIRPKDIVARYGGEEIIIFFNEFINESHLASRLEDIRSKIENTLIPGDGFSSSVTASFGCYIKESTHKISLEEVIKLADENLYTCKHTGKNKVVITK